MRECKKHEKDLVAFLCGELQGNERERFASHIDKCVRCKMELQNIKEIIASAGSLKPDIEKAMASVNWEVLPSKITETVFKKAPPSPRKGWLERFLGFLFLPKLRPVYAGILLGVLIGSLATFMIFRFPFPKERSEGEFFVSQDFLERIELEMARRETLDYLDKSQYLLLDFVQSSPEKGREFWKSEFAFQKARNLLSKKKYINPQLKKFQMAKAKEICDQIEFLFYELTQISDQLSEEDLRRIQRLIEENQLLLKIKLLKKELQESEV